MRAYSCRPRVLPSCMRIVHPVSYGWSKYYWNMQGYAIWRASTGPCFHSSRMKYNVQKLHTHHTPGTRYGLTRSLVIQYVQTGQDMSRTEPETRLVGERAWAKVHTTTNRNRGVLLHRQEVSGLLRGRATLSSQNASYDVETEGAPCITWCYPWLVYKIFGPKYLVTAK